MTTIVSILWQRQDGPGHDACRLERFDTGWQLDGASVFRDVDGQVAQLHYRVRCDASWHTQWGTVRGWVGGRAVDLSIKRDAHGEWWLNDASAQEIAHCIDLDLGFTPATNLIALRRLQLRPGEAAPAPAAWLDLGEEGLSVLDQRYERQDASRYAYQASRFEYAAVLEVSDSGFVLEYPGLWTARQVDWDTTASHLR